MASCRNETLSSVFDVWTFATLHGKHNANVMWSRVMMLKLPVEGAKMSISSTTHANN